MNLIIIIHIIILISRASSSLTRQVKVTLKILKNLTGLHERMIRCICMWSFFLVVKRWLLWKKIYHQTEKHLIHLSLWCALQENYSLLFFCTVFVFAPFFSLPPWKPINHQPEPTCAWTWITTTKTKIIAPWNLFVYGYYTTHTYRHLSNEKLPKKKEKKFVKHPSIVYEKKGTFLLENLTKNLWPVLFVCLNIGQKNMAFMGTFFYLLSISGL